MAGDFEATGTMAGGADATILGDVVSPTQPAAMRARPIVASAAREREQVAGMEQSAFRQKISGLSASVGIIQETRGKAVAGAQREGRNDKAAFASPALFQHVD